MLVLLTFHLLNQKNIVFQQIDMNEEEFIFQVNDILPKAIIIKFGKSNKLEIVRNAFGNSKSKSDSVSIIFYLCFCGVTD